MDHHSRRFEWERQASSATSLPDIDSSVATSDSKAWCIAPAPEDAMRQPRQILTLTPKPIFGKLQINVLWKFKLACCEVQKKLSKLKTPEHAAIVSHADPDPAHPKKRVIPQPNGSQTFLPRKNLHRRLTTAILT